MDKSKAREIARAALARMSGEERRQADEAICEYILSVCESVGGSVCIYNPLPDEADVSAAVRQMIAAGKRVYMPVMRGDDIMLVKADKKSKFALGRWGIKEPQGEMLMPQDARIDVCITPLVAFTSKGGRVGRGKGCYDRFFVVCPCIKAGAAYACRYVEGVELQPHDVPVDIMITEEGIVRAEDLK